jgi:hypothetical protein
MEKSAGFYARKVGNRSRQVLTISQFPSCISASLDNFRRRCLTGGRIEAQPATTKFCAGSSKQTVPGFLKIFCEKYRIYKNPDKKPFGKVESRKNE